MAQSLELRKFLRSSCLLVR